MAKEREGNPHWFRADDWPECTDEFIRVAKILTNDAAFVRATVTAKGMELPEDPIRRMLLLHADGKGLRRKWVSLVENLIRDAIRARGEFLQLPGRTPAQHKSHYLFIAKRAEELLSAITEESFNGGRYYGIGGDYELEYRLRTLAETAKDAAESPRESRPHAEGALQTYVAREIARSFELYTGGFRHEAGASLLNAIFPNDEPKDATYMQGVARNTK